MDPLSHDILAALHAAWLKDSLGLSLGEFFSRGMNGAQRDEIEAKFGRTVAQLADEIDPPPVVMAVEPEVAPEPEAGPIVEAVQHKPKRGKRSKS